MEENGHYLWERMQSTSNTIIGSIALEDMKTMALFKVFSLQYIGEFLKKAVISNTY